MRHRRVSGSQMMTVVFCLLLASSTLFAQTNNVVSVFPQFASGGGWSSDIFIDNQGISAAIVDVSFYGDNGDLIQAVLPAEDAYYLAVTDYAGRGGANGTYRLHVQFLTPPAQGNVSRSGRDPVTLRP